MRRVIFIPLFLAFMAGCVPITYTSDYDTGKQLIHSDQSYESTIKSVQLFPIGGLARLRFTTNSIPLGGDTDLLLEFDDLRATPDNYMLRIQYLKSDWSESLVNSFDYLFEYNEFRVDTYDISLNTKVPYVHYQIQLPKVKISGNYLAIIYREGNEDDIILSRRFVVFEDKVGVRNPDERAAFTAFSGHRLDFNVNYGDLPVEDPYNQLRATLRQNGRWDNAIQLIKPNLVREDINSIEFRFFDTTNKFEPVNEFRYFDMRSIISPGQFVKSVDKMTNPVKMSLQAEKSRRGIAYTFYRDLNGSYDVVNLDGGNPRYTSDYVDVEFELAGVPYDSTRRIYVFGELTNWARTEEGRLKYNRESQSYKTNLLLKQGWYDYLFYQETGNDPYVLEGNHINTENFYEILIYFTPIGSREEFCVGYIQFGINERNR